MKRIATLIIPLIALMVLPTSAVAVIPTSLGWYEVSSSSWRSLCPGDSQLNGSEDCTGVVTWGGGIYDTTRNRLCWWGGGHNSYYGNEIYCFDLDTLTSTRITNPSLSPNLQEYSGNLSVMDDGNPTSRHTYNNLAYIPTLDRYYMFGGATPTNGSFDNDTWFFNPNDNTWAEQTISGSPPAATFGMSAAWDSSRNLIWIMDDSGLYSFDPAAGTKTYTLRQSHSSSAYRVGFIDNKRHFYWRIQSETGAVYKIDISAGASTNWTEVTPSGSTAILSESWIGAEYDFVSDRAVLYSTTNTVYTMDLTTGDITGQTLGGTAPGIIGTPNCSGSSCVMGRWRYAPTVGVFVLISEPDVNAYTFRLRSAGDNDFYNRCHATGVIYCNGFDTTSDFGSYQTSRPNTGPFCPGAAETCSNLTRDTTIYASCGDLANCGAVKYHVDANGAGGDNPSGSYEIYYGTSAVLETREGDTLYYQWKARQTSLADLGGGGWKSFTLYDEKAGSCAVLELTQTNSSWRSLPYYYSECGGRAPEYNDGVDVVINWSEAYPSGGSFPAADPNFYCRYNNGNPAGLANNKCPFYETDSWRTYYCQVTVGTWGGANSTVKCAQFDDGDSDYRYIINRTNYILDKEAAATGFNTLSFTNYITGRGADQITHAAADFWIDEVIISSQPIAYPGALPAENGGTPSGGGSKALQLKVRL